MLDTIYHVPLKKPKQDFQIAHLLHMWNLIHAIYRYNYLHRYHTFWFLQPKEHYHLQDASNLHKTNLHLMEDSFQNQYLDLIYVPQKGLDSVLDGKLNQQDRISFRLVVPPHEWLPL